MSKYDRAPGQAVLDDVTDIGAAARNARHRRDVIGLERILHTDQKAEPKTPHALPCSIDGHRLKEGGLTALAELNAQPAIPTLEPVAPFAPNPEKR